MYPTPRGFNFSAVAAGFKYTQRNDLGLIVSDRPAQAAGTLTTNRFQAAPVTVCRRILEAETEVRAVVVNAGQANACTGEQGLEDCRATMDMAAQSLGCRCDEILPASTGVIGQRFSLPLWRQAVPSLVQGLAPDRALDVAQAMMTTDTFPKIVSRQICSDSNPVTITGMAKGAGMIAPNMATMLCFLLCDARVEQGWLRTVLRQAVELSFNRLTVDGDTSTNDSVLALFNGAAGPLEPRDLRSLEKEIRKVCLTLARAIAQDAEGGTKILKITVTRAKSERQALTAARTVGNSPLVKTAMYGRDPNWGRIVAALGRSGAEFDPDKVCVSIGGETIFSQGRPVEADWDAILKPVLAGSEISIDIDLQAGRSQASVLASDFTEEYIRINASYRT